MLLVNVGEIDQNSPYINKRQPQHELSLNSKIRFKADYTGMSHS
jgi:hypothetical protein